MKSFRCFDSIAAFALVLLSSCLNVRPGLAANPAPDKNQVLVYVGTYTGAKSKGIYAYRLEPGTGAMTSLGLAGEADSPSFLAIHPGGRFLYAVSEVNQFNGKPAGAVVAFALDQKTGRLTQLNQQSSVGAGPCHLVVDHAGKHVLVANYGGGSIAVLPIQPDGRLSEATTSIQHRGSSVNPQRQEGPHAHGIFLDAADRFAFVPDLGLDRVMIYHFDPKQGTLLANEPPSAAVDSGAGPRHFALDPQNHFAYVINEMKCTVTGFAYQPRRGELKQFQSISTLPEQQSVQPDYSTAEIEVHPSGKFLYGSNRGHDSIVVYAIEAKTGHLTLVQHVSTQGHTPRSFGIDPTGEYLLAANQGSDTVVVFRIDPGTGRLTATGNVIEVGAPVCVKFLVTK